MAQRQDERDGELNEGMFFSAQAAIVNVILFIDNFIAVVWPFV